jgi:hypothetical protein
MLTQRSSAYTGDESVLSTWCHHLQQPSFSQAAISQVAIFSQKKRPLTCRKGFPVKLPLQPRPAETHDKPVPLAIGHLIRAVLGPTRPQLLLP